MSALFVRDTLEKSSSLYVESEIQDPSDPGAQMVVRDPNFDAISRHELLGPYVELFGIIFEEESKRATADRIMDALVHMDSEYE